MRILAASLLIVLVGCASRQSAVVVTPLPDRPPQDIVISMPEVITHTLSQRTLSVSSAHPTARRGDYTIRLLSIGSDGATRIVVVQSGRELMARPGEYFESPEFGSQGLQLESASKRDMTASMISRICE